MEDTLNNSKYINLYAIIPLTIYQSKNLNGYDKLIAERITALCYKEGYSWVSNSFLGNMYGIRADVVSKKIKKLEKEKFIRCEYSKDNLDSKKTKRLIYLHDDVWVKCIKTLDLINDDSIGCLPKHNINNKYKKNNNTNSIISYDEDGTMLWNGIRCESIDATEEEKKQMEALLMPFQNQSKRINDNNKS